MREIGSRPDVRLITIKQGAGLNQSGTFQTFGARKGTSDVLGWLFVEAPPCLRVLPAYDPRERPEMAWLRSFIGGRSGLGIPLAFECKVGSDSLKPEQRAFLEMINRFGGIGREIRSVADCLAVLP